MPGWMGFFVGGGVLICALCVIGDMFKRWLKHREKQFEYLASSNAGQQQIERLEQRMRVLERIATDRGVVVADEIELLRDDRVN